MNVKPDSNEIHDRSSPCETNSSLDAEQVPAQLQTLSSKLGTCIGIGILDQVGLNLDDMVQPLLAMGHYWLWPIRHQSFRKAVDRCHKH